MKIILYIAASLDGFIARKDGSVDWLSLFEKAGEDYGYTEFYKSVDSLVMGSYTYETVLGFGNWPYPGKKSLVYIRRKLETNLKDIEFFSGKTDQFIGKMQEAGLKRIWLAGGGKLINTFRKAGLIDEFIISVVPLFLGEGIPLFPGKFPQQELKLVNVKKITGGLVQLHYKRQQWTLLVKKDDKINTG